ncbi:MAG: Gfo/Idh/MocA family protein [Armatimonadota bacterium]
MKDKLRIGIIGAGNILTAHAAGFKKMQDHCTVVAVAKANPANAEQVHALFGPDVRIEQDYRAILAMEDIDAVDILLPHDMHMQSTIEAAQAGKQVMVEKVMARNIYECDRMIEACEQAGVSLTVTHDRRYQPDWMALKQVVDSGILGDIYFWRLEHNQDVSVPSTSWIYNRNQLGGGAVMSCLTHQIDGLRWYAGEVESVTSMSKIIPARMEGETIGAILARMQSGALAQITINWATRGGWSSANALPSELNHVTGSRGEAYYACGKGTFLMLYDEPERGAAFVEDGNIEANQFAKVKAGKWSGHERCVSEWIKMLLGEEAEVTTSGREVRGTVEVAEAAYRAEQAGCTVTLPIVPEPWQSVAAI